MTMDDGRHSSDNFSWSREAVEYYHAICLLEDKPMMDAKVA
jgi:hypothetical protein